MPTHVHPRAPMHSHTLLLQGKISIMMQPPVKSHAGTSLRPRSSLYHYPLRLSGFRKIEEGLKSFEEKQVGLEPRLLNPHLPILPGVCSYRHLLNAQHLGTIETTQPLGKKCLAEQGQPRRGGSHSAACFGCLLFMRWSSMQQALVSTYYICTELHFTLGIQGQVSPASETLTKATTQARPGRVQQRARSGWWAPLYSAE